MSKICTNPECKKEIQTAATYCPFCGKQQVPDEELSEEEKLRKRIAELEKKIKESENGKDDTTQKVVTELQKQSALLQKQIEDLQKGRGKDTSHPDPSGDTGDDGDNTNTKKILKRVIPILLGVLLIAVGIFVFFYVIRPKILEKNAPRYYVCADGVRLRSESTTASEILMSMSSGRELIVLDSSFGWLHVKIEEKNADGKVVDTKKGYVSSDYVMTKPDYFLLNSIFGNEEAKKMLDKTKYRKAILNYFKDKRLIGNMTAQDVYDAGMDSTLANAEKWQVFCKDPDAKENNVYRSNKYNKNGNLAVIIKNIDTGGRILLYFSFDSDGNSHLLCEQVAPYTGYMKDKTLKLDEFAGVYNVTVSYTSD